MSTPCAIPAQSSDGRYVFGTSCTWHGPIAEAGKRRDNTPCCPVCADDLLELGSESEFEASVREADRSRPGYAEIIAWGRGRHFPDFDTLENAFRQHMEGRS